MDVFIQFAVAASQFAVDDAQPEVTPENADDVGVFIASGHRRVQHHRARAHGAPQRRPAPHLAVLHSRVHHQSGGRPGVDPVRRARARTSRRARPARPRRTPSARRSRSSRRGDADVMIAGGSEASITPMGVGGFAAMRALSTRNDEPARASRPFDKDRDGFVVGEGAGHPDSRRTRRSRSARGAHDLRRDRRLRPVGRRVPPDGAAGGRQRRRAIDADGAAQGRRAARSRSTTSTRTAHRRRSTTRPRRWR